MEGTGVLAVTAGFERDFHILIERHEETQQALNGKLSEVASRETGPRPAMVLC
jgi:hypothetical protein